MTEENKNNQQDTTLPENGGDLSFYEESTETPQVIETPEKPPVIDEHKGETVSDSPDLPEKAYLREKGIDGAQTLEEAVDNYVAGKKAFEAQREKFAAAEKLIAKHGFQSFDAYLSALKELPETGGEQVKTDNVKRLFDSLLEEYKSSDERLKAQYEAQEIESFTPQTPVFTRTMDFFNKYSEAIAQDMEMKIMGKIGEPLQRLIQKDAADVLSQEWDTLPDKTKTRWGEHKKGIIDFILSDEKLYKKEKPFLRGISAYREYLEQTKPDAIKDDIEEAVQKKIDERLSEARKRITGKFGSNGKVEASDDLPANATEAQYTAWKNKQELKLQKIFGS